MKVRCISAEDAGELESGAVYDVHDETPDSYVFLWADGSKTSRFKGRFEPVTDEPDKDLLNLAFPCPKVDPYAAHRLRECSAVAMEQHDRASGATARLHAGLESEKAQERVKAFPKQGRNFALKGGGDE